MIFYNHVDIILTLFIIMFDRVKSQIVVTETEFLFSLL